MSLLTSGMIAAGIAALLAGLFLVRARFAAASGAGKILVLGPIFEAVALAIFAAEHFLAARELSGGVALVTGTPVLDLLCGRGSAGCGHQLHRVAIRAPVGVPARTLIPDHRCHNRPAQPAAAHS